jgi:hypothetical protein
MKTIYFIFYFLFQLLFFGQILGRGFTKLVSIGIGWFIYYWLFYYYKIFDDCFS